jgi:hypothetical protein
MVENDPAAVQFDLDGSELYETESEAPYTLGGDHNGNYWNWNYTIAPHTLSVKALDSEDAVIHSYDVDFTIVSSSDEEEDTTDEEGGDPTDEEDTTDEEEGDTDEEEMNAGEEEEDTDEEASVPEPAVPASCTEGLPCILKLVLINAESNEVIRDVSAICEECHMLYIFF